MKGKKAVAIKYDPKDIAPKVVAKGEGELADKIVEIGEKNDIHIYKDEKLVEELTRIELGANIPSELYEVVAEILIFIEGLDHSKLYHS